jgi:hypothetical protein
LYKGVVVQGIDLSGDPYFGTFGLIGCGAVLFFARMFAHSTAYRVYESADQQRIGFQVHTILGFPGRKLEVPLGNARYVTPSNILTRGDEELAKAKQKSGFMSKVMNTSMVPVRVIGFKGNMLIDSDGDFYDKNRLNELLSDPEKHIASSAKKLAVEWNKNGAKSRKHSGGSRK